MYQQLITASILGTNQTQLKALQLLEAEILNRRLDVDSLFSCDFNWLLELMLDSEDLELKRNTLNMIVSIVFSLISCIEYSS